MPVELRRLGPLDASAPIHVAEDVFDGPLLPDRLAAFLNDPSHILIVAVDGGVPPLVVGQIRGMIHRRPDAGDELYIDDFGVAPSYRRGGIGRRLLAAIHAWAHERGCEEVWVLTEPDNAPARAIYAGEGFEGSNVSIFVRPLLPDR